MMLPLASVEMSTEMPSEESACVSVWCPSLRDSWNPGSVLRSRMLALAGSGLSSVRVAVMWSVAVYAVYEFVGAGVVHAPLASEPPQEKRVKGLPVVVVLSGGASRQCS